MQQIANIVLGVRGIISQTGNLQNWENSAGTALTAITKDGNIIFNSTQTVDGRDLSVDGAKLDTIEPYATYSPLTSSAPQNVTKSAASVGTDGYSARADHKHDVSTASAIANPPGTSNAEGTATSLARSDHTHQLASFGTTSGTFCQGNDSRLSDDRTASGLRTATTVVSVASATAPSANQVLVATSSTAAEWQTLSSGTFGNNYQFESDETTTTTTSSTYQDKVTLTTSTLTGTYRVEYYCEMASGSGNRTWNSRLYNSTDATELCLNNQRPSTANLFYNCSGYQIVTFTGSAKTFKIQFNSADNNTTMSIRRARIIIWRVA